MKSGSSYATRIYDAEKDLDFAISEAVTIAVRANEAKLTFGYI